jgi:hypothetical protein
MAREPLPLRRGEQEERSLTHSPGPPRAARVLGRVARPVAAFDHLHAAVLRVGVQQGDPGGDLQRVRTLRVQIRRVCAPEPRPTSAPPAVVPPRAAYAPWCQGTTAASAWGALGRRFQTGWPATSTCAPPSSCCAMSSRRRSLHRRWNAGGSLPCLWRSTTVPGYWASSRANLRRWHDQKTNGGVSTKRHLEPYLW